MPDWARIRSEFPVTKQYIYLNHAAVSPLSRPVREAMRGFLDDATFHGAVHARQWYRTIQQCRTSAAQLINASADEIAFMKNTTQGLIIAANGIPWQPGDNVVLPNVEFPANVYPWWNLESQGVEIRFVKEVKGRIPYESIEAAMDEHTRALTISFVEFASGFRNDLVALGNLCRERDIWFIVDVIQGLGALPVDVREAHIDILAADGHKWLLAPEGAAIFYCARRRLDQLHNTNLGWAGVVHPGDYLNYDRTQVPSAERFEEGSFNSIGLYGLKAAIDFLWEIGIEAIEGRILLLTDLLIERVQAKGYEILSSLNPKERSGIVVIRHPEHDTVQIVSMLADQNVIVAARGGGIRISPHCYNTEDEILKFVELLP